MKASVSIHDVARHAGVSKSTVSLVLQNSPHVHKETRKMVEDAIQALGYVYNRHAANMRGGKNNLIALIMHDILNPFFSELAYHIQQLLFAKNYILLLANSNDNIATERQIIASVMEQKVSGIFISPAIDMDCRNLEILETMRIPVIQLSRFFKTQNRLHTVKADNGQAVYQAFTYLKQKSCKKIGYLGGLQASPLMQERYAGYVKGAAQYGDIPLLVEGESSRQFGYENIMSLVKHHQCDGVLCFNDLVALGAHHRLNEEHIQIGKTVKLIGFDNIQECHFVSPSLTSIDLSPEILAERASIHMMKWLENKDEANDTDIIPTRLIERQSA